MAAVGAVQVHCPECDVVMPIGMVAKSSTREGDKLIVNVEPDLVDGVAHAWTHGQAGDDH